MLELRIVRDFEFGTFEIWICLGFGNWDLKLCYQKMSNFWQKIKKPILALAPMAGISDSAFRQICRDQGADVVYTEMTSVDGLYYDSKKTLEMLAFSKKEKPVVCQLFGKKPELFGKAAKVVEKTGFDGIDINFGCPARKVVAHGGGVTLMRDFDLCHSIIDATIKATKLPVSIKIRTSINKAKESSEKVYAYDFLKKVSDLDIAAVMVHGRSYEQGFSGPVDIEQMKKIRAAYPGILLVNGGVIEPPDALELINKTKANGIGLARSVRGRPWLFRQVKELADKGKYIEPSMDDIKKVIIKHSQAAFAAKQDHGIIEMRKHLAWYTKGFPGAKELRQKLVRVNTVDDIKNILK